MECSLQTSDIKDIYRTSTASKEGTRPIIVELTSVLKKEDILAGIKKFNKTRVVGDKLNTEHLRLPGPKKPIYVSETLTYKTQKLFHSAREVTKIQGYNYCWTTRGVVYIRKSENDPAIRITSDSDLDAIRSKA